jgi:hypothetical protein
VGLLSRGWTYCNTSAVLRRRDSETASRRDSVSVRVLMLVVTRDVMACLYARRSEWQRTLVLSRW